MTLAARTLTLAALLLGGLAHAAPATASEPTEFIRVAEDGGRPTALQVAIVSYAPASGDRDLRVDLIGAVHVGDAAYYRGLNETFRAYEALLYEMVIPDDSDDSRDYEYDMSFIAGTQVGLKNALGLAYQLDEIDYKPGNLVHADLTSSKLAASMEEREESLYVYFWRIFFASLDEYAKDPLGLEDMRLIGSLLSGQRHDAFKIALAYELADASNAGDILGGVDGSAVIAARNEHAVDILEEQIQTGKRRIGIFYGVAHMPDFEERLTGRLGLERVSTVWIDAWDLAPADDAE